MKGGIGSYAVQIGDLKVGAIVAVNARGDIYDWKDGKKVAGLLNGERIRLPCWAAETAGKQNPLHPHQPDSQSSENACPVSCWGFCHCEKGRPPCRFC